MADLEQGVAVRPDTVFNIASVSKQFTAVSLLLLQEQGKLSLDTRYTLKVVAEQLQVVVGHQPPVPLYAVDGRRFYNSGIELALTFSGSGFDVQAGEIQRLRFERVARR